MVEETEPEWDDEQRTLMRALVAYESGICDCGYHSSLTSDPSNFFTFEESRCPVCKEAARWGRLQAAADDADDKRAGDNPPPERIKPADGRRTFIRRMTPTEVERAKSRVR